MKKVITQIYGIRTVEDAVGVVALGADHIGVSYGKTKGTPGQLSCEEAKEIFDKVQSHAVRVGLTVSEDIDVITRDLLLTMPQVLHLSGDIEGITPEEVAVLRGRFPGLKIMQAIPVLQGVPKEEQKAFEYIKLYEGVSDFFLIDTKAKGALDIGATGLTHDWEIDRELVNSTKVPCIIAGGLDAANVTAAVETARPYGADSFSLTNLKVPGRKGIKDMNKVKAFIEAVRKARI
ncbi:MAG: phosphoribosylanthranilate isomerase [Oscillospiraceae bacterium]|nr:phosphoribosylanthranilate isomerase [Oscillospiraceae bacterium]